MTETVTTAETTPVKELKPLPDTLALMATSSLQVLSALADKLNGMAKSLNSVSNTAALLFEMRDEAETDDEMILKYRAFMDSVDTQVLAAQTAIEEHIRKSGLLDTPDIDVDAVTAAYKTDVAVFNGTVKMLRNLGVTDEHVNYPTLDSVDGVRKQRSSSGAGIIRPRFTSVKYRIAGSDEWLVASHTTEKDGVRKTVSTLSVLAQLINTRHKGKGVSVQASSFQADLFACAGTQDLTSLNGEPFTFVYNVKGKEEAFNYEIQVTPAVA